MKLQTFPNHKDLYAEYDYFGDASYNDNYSEPSYRSKTTNPLHPPLFTSHLLINDRRTAFCNFPASIKFSVCTIKITNIHSKMIHSNNGDHVTCECETLVQCTLIQNLKASLTTQFSSKY